MLIIEGGNMERRMKMRRMLILFFLSIFTFQFSMSAQLKLTPEEEQQFTYYWYAARLAVTEERFADAYALLEFCHMIKPDDGTTLTFLGVLYDGMGQKEKAIEMYRQAFEAAPRDQWYKYTEALLAQRDYKQALSVLEQAYGVQSGKDATREKKTRKREEKGQVDQDLLEQLKRMYIAHEQWEKALGIQDELDGQRGFDAYSALSRYRIYAMWGKTKKAIEVLDRYLETDPTNVQFLLFRLELMERSGARQAELYAMYRRILELDPYNTAVLNNYAYHLATHGGDLKEAEKMSALTIREQPDNPVYLDTYGWILHLQGQDSLAKFYLRKALQNAAEDSKTEILQHLKDIER